MPLSNEESQEIYNILAGSLRQHKLEWVVEQVEKEIERGKWSSEKLSTYKPSETRLALPIETEQGFTAKGKAEFIVLLEYSAKERLSLLADAIEEAVANTALMEQAVAEALEGKVEFREDDSIQTIAFPSDEFFERRIHAEELRNLLDELRREIGI